MPTRGAYYLIIFGKNVSHEPYLLVIDSSNVLQLRTSLTVASVAEDTYIKNSSTLKIAFRSKIYINSKISVLKIVH